MKITQIEVKWAIVNGMKTILELEEYKNGNHNIGNNSGYNNNDNPRQITNQKKNKMEKVR